jgi:two-component system, chemotaxis family, response regulator Rcp1
MAAPSSETTGFCNELLTKGTWGAGVIDCDVRPIEILMVEDNPADARWAKEALKEGRIHNTTSVVADGEAALAYLRRQGKFYGAARPDLILLDLNLPKKSGVEVLNEVKTDPDLRDIPVVVLTTSPIERQSLLRTYNLPSNSYILKPLNWSRFLDAVRCYNHLELMIVKCDPSPPAS